MATTIDTPKVLRTPFASQGDFNEVPQTNDQTQGLVSVAYGFPPITSLSVETEGGIPPKRRDMNGALNLLSTHNFSSQNGGIYTFNQDVSDAIGGYAKGAVLGYVDSNGDYFNVVSLKNNNTANFNTNPSYIGDGVNWKKISTDKYMTNCLLEVPQNVKMELNNGTLTVKAGTVGYLKNGNTNTLSQDVSQTITTSDGDYFVFITSPTTISFGLTSTTYESLSEGITLPIGVVKVSGGTITSIENVFNGVGYIGDAVFVLPNVSFLLPAGRNADGSLKNIFVKTNSIQVNTSFASGNAKGEITINNLGFPLWWGYLGELKEQPPAVQYFGYYNITDNKTYFSSNGQTWDFNPVCVVGSFVMENGVIKSIDVKNTFTALDLYQIPNLWATNTTYVSGQNPSVIVEEGEGYVKLSSGVMIQWGVSIQSNRFPTIVLPQPYIDANYTACTFSNAGSGGDRATTSTYGFTTTQYQCRIQNDAAGEFRFMTIGRWK